MRSRAFLTTMGAESPSRFKWHINREKGESVWIGVIEPNSILSVSPPR